MKLIKLTSANGQTYGGCQWGENVEHTAPGTGELCGPGYIHAYTDSLLAVLFNVIHANFESPLGWEADGDVEREDHGLKVGCTRLKTIKQISLPVITTSQRVRFAILCALEIYSDPLFVQWAGDWLSGKDRTEMAAWAAEAARAAAAWAAVEAKEAGKPIDFIAIIHKAMEEET